MERADWLAMPSEVGIELGSTLESGSEEDLGETWQLHKLVHDSDTTNGLASLVDAIQQPCDKRLR